MNTYPRVDLSRLFIAPKAAVFFQDICEIELFYHNCVEQCKSYIRHWYLADMVAKWENNEGCGFTFMTGDEPESMSWCDKRWFEESGYEIIEFADLVNPIEIEESEISIDVLLSQDSASIQSC